MAAIRPQPADDSIQPAPLIGRDEMNLAEFPIAILADRVPKGQKTLYFEDNHGRLTVTGSDAYGLPTATDTDVIVALLYLTKIRNGFSDVKVNFTKYEIIKLLNWSDESWYYKRIEQSFHRWSGVLLVYDKCWWDNKSKRYVSANMHIMDSVIFSEPGGNIRDGQSYLPLSTFTWNKTFIESCQADNLRQLNLDEYFSLKSAVSKRLYRFLGKRFYLQGDWKFDLNEIAFDRVGLSRGYADAGKIKEKLQPAIEELEAIGFLRPLARDDRYSRIDRGQWTIRLTRQSPALTAMQAAPKTIEQKTPPLAAELTKRGVSNKIAADLVREYDADSIRQQIEILDWRLSGKKADKIDDPAAWLVSAIKHPHAAPKGFISKADREHQAEAIRQRHQAEAEQRRSQQQQVALERAEDEAVTAYRKALTPEALAKHEADAITRASEEMRQSLDDPRMARFRKTMLMKITDEHIRQMLRNRPPAEV